MEEPVRKSVLDYVQRTKRVNLCRLVFCAKVTSNCVNVIELFDKIMKTKYSQVTGLLLAQFDLIIHLVESSENEVFQLCNEVFTAHPEAIGNVKCLYIQHGARKRFFKKWYARKISDYVIQQENDKIETADDNFETITAMHRTVIRNLHKLYTDLWNISILKSHDDFIQQLDVLSKKGDSNIPCKQKTEVVLESRWGYDLRSLVKDYCNLKYSCNFNDWSSVSDIIRKINYNAKLSL